MGNILTQALSYTQQDINDNFVAPAFLGTDVIGITVLTGIKGTKELTKLTRPSKITKANSVGFTATGTISMTNQSVTVVPLKAEIEQNGEAFIDSIFSLALANGYNLDDVEQMSGPALWNTLVLPIIADAVKQDKNRMMWFGDTTHETLVGTTPDANPSASLDTDFTPYNGLWTTIFTDVAAGTIPAAQKVSLSNAAVAEIVGLQVSASGLAGTLTINVNNTNYTYAYTGTPGDTAVAAGWIAGNATTVNARAGINGVTVATSGSGVISITADADGQGFNYSAAITSGSVNVVKTVAAVEASALTTDEADDTFDAMITAMPVEMQQFKSDLRFYATRTMVRNYIQTLKATGTTTADKVIVDGIEMYSYEGIPIIQMPDWDNTISTDFNNVYPHRAILTIPSNLVFATDGAADDGAIQSWYNIDDEMRRTRIKYRAGVAYIHSKLMVIAY